MWNHNIHYGRRLAARLGATASTALDIGCGEGWLVAELARDVPFVVGLDPDREVLDLARAHLAADERGRTALVRGGVLTAPFPPRSFDLVLAVASLHHLGEEDGLRRMRDLVAPGGALGIVGLARSRGPRDHLVDLLGAMETRARALRNQRWESSAPVVWPPPHTYAELRTIAAEVLPGSSFRRRAMWRYEIAWHRPPTD